MDTWFFCSLQGSAGSGPVHLGSGLHPTTNVVLVLLLKATLCPAHRVIGDIFKARTGKSAAADSLMSLQSRKSLRMKSRGSDWMDARLRQRVEQVGMLTPARLVHGPRA